LGRNTVEGLRVEPLYTAADVAGSSTLDGFPGQFPFLRGGPIGEPKGWSVRQEYDHPNPAAAASAALEDLSLGADSLWITLASSLRRVNDELSTDGVVVDRQSAMARLLRDLDLSKVPVFFDAGAAGVSVAATIGGVVGDATPGLQGGVLADPLGVLAETGSLGLSLDRAYDDMAELLVWGMVKAPKLHCVGVSAVAAHEAGASAVTELSVALATGVEYLRRMDAAGHSPEFVASRMLFRFAVGRDLFVSVAKLRAARLIWARVCEACGTRSAEAAMKLQVRGSSRTRTRRDPWVNLLRGTVETVAAIVGGAGGVATTRFDDALDGRSDVSSRMALNTQVLLREESGFADVIDPAGGSHYVEAMTQQLAEAAWRRFQEIERAGGMTVSLADFSVQAQVGRDATRRRTAVAHARLPITGVSDFAFVEEDTPELEKRPGLPASIRGVGALADETAVTARLSALAGAVRGARVLSAIEAAAAGATSTELLTAIPDPGEPATVTPLVRIRLAQDFEALRDASDALFASTGARPLAFSFNFGPVQAYKPRADFARNALASAGFLVDDAGGFEAPAAAAEAFAASAAKLAVICSSEKLYDAHLDEAISAARARGALQVVVAGPPREGVEVDAFVHAKCDRPAVLRELMQKMGVLE
jgi:methylmalonyl-CoA mutase